MKRKRKSLFFVISVSIVFGLMVIFCCPYILALSVFWNRGLHIELRWNGYLPSIRSEIWQTDYNNFYNVQYSEQELVSVCNVLGLEYFCVYNQNLTDRFFNSISRCSHLQDLEFYDSSFPSNCLSHLNRNYSVKYVSIGNFKHRYPLIDLSSINNPRINDISFSNLTISDAGFGNSSNLINLQSIILNDCKFASRHGQNNTLQFIISSKSLQRVHIYKTLDSSDILTLLQSKNVERFSFTDNLDAKVFSNIKTISQQIKALIIENKYITDETLQNFQGELNGELALVDTLITEAGLKSYLNSHSKYIGIIIKFSGQEHIIIGLPGIISKRYRSYPSAKRFGEWPEYETGIDK